MQDNFYTMENLAPLDRDIVYVDVGRILSIMDFHLDKWGGKGTADWERPTYDQHQALPAPPAGSEIPEDGEEPEDDIPPPDQPPLQQDVGFSISQEMWTNMQARLDGYDARLGNMEQTMVGYATRINEVTNSLRNMDVKQDLFYDECEFFFREFRGHYPPLHYKNKW